MTDLEHALANLGASGRLRMAYSVRRAAVAAYEQGDEAQYDVWYALLAAIGDAHDAEETALGDIARATRFAEIRTLLALEQQMHGGGGWMVE